MSDKGDKDGAGEGSRRAGGTYPKLLAREDVVGVYAKNVPKSSSTCAAAIVTFRPFVVFIFFIHDGRMR